MGALTLSAAAARAQQSPAVLALPPGPKALLPASFAGWSASDAPKALPASSDAALAEYGLLSGATAKYKHGGQKLTLRLLRFRDASGAYGYYSISRQSNWRKEDLGSGAASFQNRIFFWKGASFVDASFSSAGPKAVVDLRELARQIPDPFGPRRSVPPILANLPQKNLEHLGSRYTLGPAAYAAAGGLLPANLVGFDRGAEALTASYRLASGPATLTLIDYPTPQIAEAAEPRLRAYLKAGAAAQPARPAPLAASNPASIELRRSGPLVAFVAGSASPADCRALLASIHFAADFTALPNVGDSETTKTAKLLFGIAMLVLVGAGAAILLGFSVGGGRALYRISRGKPASSVFDEEFIHLDLTEKFDAQNSSAAEPVDKPSPKL